MQRHQRNGTKSTDVSPHTTRRQTNTDILRQKKTTHSVPPRQTNLHQRSKISTQQRQYSGQVCFVFFLCLSDSIHLLFTAPISCFSTNAYGKYCSESF